MAGHIDLPLIPTLNMSQHPRHSVIWDCPGPQCRSDHLSYWEASGVAGGSLTLDSVASTSLVSTMISSLYQVVNGKLHYQVLSKILVKQPSTHQQTSSLQHFWEMKDWPKKNAIKTEDRSHDLVYFLLLKIPFAFAFRTIGDKTN